MVKNAKKVLTLTLILLAAVCTINIQAGYAATKILTVPTEYPTITAALMHAADGDTIMVQSGVYQENLQVNKSVSIVGQNSKSTFLIGEGGLDRGARPAVALAADDASISGFTIESQNYSIPTIYALGVYIQADNCQIIGNNIENCYLGVFSSAQSHAEIKGNTISSCLKDGMRFYGASHYTIQNNTIIDNAVSGLALQGYSNAIINNTFEGNYRALGLGASYSVVFGNKILNDKESGIFLAGSKNIVVANEIADNEYSIYITSQLAASHDNTFYHNNFVNNLYGVYANESAPVEFWDNGTAGGNYWSDYTSKYPHALETSESFYNTAYQVYPTAYDSHPLVAPFNTANPGNPPPANPTPEVASNGLVAYWTFDSVDASGITLDQTGNNPAILGSTNGNESFNPKIIEGKYGNALAFNGEDYINVPSSPSLEIRGDVTVDVWVNVQAYKDIPYNNIIVEARRTTAALPSRTLGVAINGEAPPNSSAPEIGAIRGYVLTKNGLNEIATVQPVVMLNQWIHVVFIRSQSTGMHIYVDGQEQQVIVTSGTQNPQGSVLRPTETYIGHDAICTIDNLKLSNTVIVETQPPWMQWWLWASILAGVAFCGLLVFALRRSKAAKEAVRPNLGKV